MHNGNKIAVSTLWFEKTVNMDAKFDLLLECGVQKLELTPFAKFIEKKSLTSFYKKCDELGFEIVGWQGIFYGVNSIGECAWNSRCKDLSLMIKEFEPKYLCFGAPQLRTDPKQNIEHILKFLSELENTKLYFEVLSKKFGGNWGNDASEVLVSFDFFDNFGLLYDSFGSTASDCELHSIKPNHLHVSSDGLKDLSIDKVPKDFLQKYIDDPQYVTLEQMRISNSDMRKLLKYLKSFLI